MFHELLRDSVTVPVEPAGFDVGDIPDGATPDGVPTMTIVDVGKLAFAVRTTIKRGPITSSAAALSVAVIALDCEPNADPVMPASTSPDGVMKSNPVAASSPEPLNVKAFGAAPARIVTLEGADISNPFAWT